MIDHGAHLGRQRFGLWIHGEHPIRITHVGFEYDHEVAGVKVGLHHVAVDVDQASVEQFREARNDAKPAIGNGHADFQDTARPSETKVARASLNWGLH
jgi:hypothetical protein